MKLFLFSLELWILFSLEEVFSIKLTYEWYANLTAGSLLPSEHLSRTSITSNLVVYVINNYYVFQLTSSIDTHNNKFHLPFQIVYNDDDVSFFGHEEDQIWSINMKKSLATLFQVKTRALDPGSFESEETNTYGTCEVEYITSKSNIGTQIVKLINKASCTNAPDKRRSNTPLFACPSTFQEGVANHNERLYTLLQTHSPYISEILSSGTIHFQPFQALAEAHYIEVNQYLRLIQVSNESLPVGLNNSLTQQSNAIYSAEVVQAPTFGHFPENKTLLKEKIHQLLENLAESLNWKLGTQCLDNQTSFHILELMASLDIDDWEGLYNTISVGTSYSQETIQHFFWDFIPQVGSEASIVFIKRLVKSKKVKGFIASLLLVTFPLHLNHVSEKFLVESEDFLYITDVDTDVHNACILSFAVLVRLVCNNHCSKELLDRYTKYYLDKFMETPNYENQMVYLQAISNLQLSRILDFLSPIVTNPSYDRHIRYLTIWCMMPTIKNHPEKATEIFWPLFTNNTEPLEIRVSALYILLRTKPTASRLLTFFWHIQKESNYHLYNFFYTTIHSIANSKYPCYLKIRNIASQLSRYLLPRAYRWATGNYMIDYEDGTRGYGGLINLFIVASEKSGLPSTLVLSTEQHSHGLSSKFSIHLKLEGVVNTIWKTFFDVNNFTSYFSTMNIEKFLKETNFSINTPERAHVEMLIKIDGNTVYCKYLNESTFADALLSIEEASALYYEFSVNYQRVRFPLKYEVMKLNDLGTPVNLQIRTSSLLSTRGSIKQGENGIRRDAELDFRYSMNTVTSLKTLNPLTKGWQGADRTRSLHVRVPFSNHLFEKRKKSFFELTAERHKDFVNSRHGVVWHSTIKLFPSQNHSEEPSSHGNNGKHWSLESRDLGARFDGEIFDCKDDNNLFGSLQIIKEAFQLSSKNYKMVIGGVPILGLFSLANYFTFIPPGDSCGIIVSMTPLQVQLALVSEGKTFHVTMRTEQEKQQIWDLIIKNREVENEGLKRIDFKLEHSEHERNFTITNGSWRLVQLEGYLKSPSFRQGILNAPSPVEGQMRFSWEHKKQVTSIELALRADNSASNWPVNCENDTALCLQRVSNLAIKQTLTMNCVNLPIWATTALLSIFPDNVHAEKQSTNIQFSLPAKLPWTTQGECVVNSNSVLNFDNGTIQNYPQRTDCYSIAVAECVSPSQFVVGVKKIPSNKNTLEMKIVSSHIELIVSSMTENSHSLIINNTKMTVQNYYQFYPTHSNSSNCIFQFKYWEKTKMIELVIGQSELILQYYGETLAAVASFKLRGRMCGLCGDFNGEISNDNVKSTACVNDLQILH